MNDRQDRELEDWGRRAAAALRASEAVDADTRARLAAVRAQAVAGVAPRAPRPWAWAVSGALAAGLVGALLLPPRLHEPAPAPEMVTHDTLDVLVDEQDPQFYRDLDLYLWLDEASGHA